MFKKNKWMYYPTSLSGWIITLVFLALIAQIFIAVDSKSHSVSDTFYGVLPYVISYVVIYWWLASRLSR
ncbi:hypothetical protein KW805_02940 [Candidatus Pacearchaeota archaeon]|nr:hypothetical protein [Candidatus Pacearchaeota archaeon]